MGAVDRDFTSQFTNLVLLLRKGIERYAERPLFGVRKGETWEWISYRQFGDRVDRFRGGLQSLGVSRRDRVAVISNNRLEWAVGAHAVYSLGACYVPMYEAQLDQEWRYILADCGAKVCLVANAGIEKRVRAFSANLPALAHIVNFEGSPTELTSYAALMDYGATHPAAPVVPEDSDIACFIYTSGTTGNPKGVRLSHLNLASNLSGVLTRVDIDDQDRGLAFLPWAHVFGGCVELNLAIGTGGSTAICSEPMKLGQYLPEVKPTILFAVPRVYTRIYDGVQKAMSTKPAAVQWMFNTAMRAKNKLRNNKPIGLGESLAVKAAEKIVFPKVRQAFGGRLKYAVSGAAALPREVAEFIDNLGIEMYEGYGMTECSGVTTAHPRGKQRLGSVGQAIPGVRIVIDKNVPGAAGDIGEIVVYGSSVMQGYHHLEEVTRQAMTEDGGLRTGDLGRLDADGYLYITGRVKELYKLENGKYVAPAPLEEKLALSPYILQCVVYGADHAHNVALIIPDMPALRAWAKEQQIEADDDALLRDPRVRTLLEGEVAKFSKDFKGFEQIKHFVIDTEELTTQNGMLTPTLKLKRSKVVEKYEKVFESLYPPAPSENPAPRSSYIRELGPGADTRRTATP